MSFQVVKMIEKQPYGLTNAYVAEVSWSRNEVTFVANTDSLSDVLEFEYRLYASVYGSISEAISEVG
jgi:hypothetical protein